jgi:hypothetical protein
VLMNIECDDETLQELEHAFRFNDAVLRHLTTRMDELVTTPSPMMREEKPRSERDRGRDRDRGDRGDRGDRDRGPRAERAPQPAPPSLPQAEDKPAEKVEEKPAEKTPA